MHPLTLYALDLARERERDFTLDRLVAEARRSRPSGPSRFRRPVAQVLAGLSRVSAAAVRRLDECVADDLDRSLAVTE